LVEANLAGEDADIAGHPNVIDAAVRARPAGMRYRAVAVGERVKAFTTKYKNALKYAFTVFEILESRALRPPA
jgi:hypothetical protein